jgi:hypothetical protein
VTQSSEEHAQRCARLDRCIAKSLSSPGYYIELARRHFVPHSRSLTRADGDAGAERAAALEAFAENMRSFYERDKVSVVRVVPVSEYTEKIAPVDKLLQEIFTRGFHAGVQDQRSIIDRLERESQAKIRLITSLQKRVQDQQVRIEELMDRVGLEVVGIRRPRN